MEKPNITEGEWIMEIPDSGIGLVLVNTTDELTIHDGFDIANAKAISAVPEMIDALFSVMEHNEIPCQENYDNMIKQCKQALIKAGCNK